MLRVHPIGMRVANDLRHMGNGSLAGAAIGLVVEWRVLATKWLKPHVGFQVAVAGHPMAATGWTTDRSLSFVDRPLSANFRTLRPKSRPHRWDVLHGQQITADFLQPYYKGVGHRVAVFATVELDVTVDVMGED